ncbi:efflux RND transporter permease subunit [Natronosalvus rutilus]|uniref:Efflux RND transporter permease subunit n=1 Tax=Natronosalvus rutilus TaxID=2953753 RepID=A0A9E7NBJ3_9EURY|nr:efflux RND transporter permease subunit [Natronosalvus rutilus]UTF54406.1 efflux RND transporter permease subunit [Natronosalvus rutilus]
MDGIGKLAVVLVVIGAVLLAGPVFGFTTISADRGVSVNTASDPNGLLGVIDNSAAGSADVVPSNNQRGEVFHIDDNAGLFDVNDVTINEVRFNGQETNLDAQVETDGTNGDYAVVVTCGTSNLKDQGTLTVDLTASSSVTVDLERTTGAEIDVNCRGGGNGNNDPPGLEVTSVDSVQGGVVEFTVNNTGGKIDITEVSVTRTSTAATEISQGNQAGEVIVNGGAGNTETASASPWEIRDQIVEFDNGNGKRVTLETGNLATVTIDAFVNESGEEVSMDDAEIDMTFYGKNGESDSVTVTISCDSESTNCEP